MGAGAGWWRWVQAAGGESLALVEAHRYPGDIGWRGGWAKGV